MSDWLWSHLYYLYMYIQFFATCLVISTLFLKTPIPRDKITSSGWMLSKPIMNQPTQREVQNVTELKIYTDLWHLTTFTS